MAKKQSWADCAVTPGGEDVNEVIERSAPISSYFELVQNEPPNDSDPSTPKYN